MGDKKKSGNSTIDRRHTITRLIQQHEQDFEWFGKVGFEIQALPGSKTGPAEDAAAGGMSAEARTWAESNGIITGDGSGNMQYKAAYTGEMIVVVPAQAREAADEIN